MLTSWRAAVLGSALIAACLVMTLAGCGSTLTTMLGRHVPPWQLQWDPSHASGSGTSAQAAFAAAAVVYKSDGTTSAPAATFWLATGPKFGLAAVQLDPAGTAREFDILAVDSKRDVWQLAMHSALLPPCAHGTANTIGTVSLGETCDIDIGGGLNAPAFEMHSWATPTAQYYIALGINATATRPTTTAATVALPAGQGWRTQAGDYTAIVLPLPHGQTFVLAGTGDAARVQQLAAQASTQLGAFVPTATTLPPVPLASPSP